MRSFFISLSLLFATFLSNAQTPSSLSTDFKLQKKGQFYFYWGYNRAWFAKSDINFTGPGYNFTLHDVVAKDRPSSLSWQYLNITEFSVPQYNYRLGYFISDKYSISVGWDHMKYVMQVPQTVNITGYIGEEISSPGIPTTKPSGNYAGDYHNEPITITPDFLTFEHTDGLNYISVAGERYDQLWQSKKHPKLGLTVVTGLGAGFVLPRSDVRLFETGENNHFNVAGWGVSASAGIKLNILKWLYFQSDLKAGYLDMNAIHTTGRNKIDGANQHIKFLENYWVLGFRL